MAPRDWVPPKIDVLHLAAAAQLLGAGLAQNPADGVGDVRLARAVRPDNAGNALADLDLCLIGEGFEALDFQFFQAHSMGTFQNS